MSNPMITLGFDGSQVEAGLKKIEIMSQRIRTQAAQAASTKSPTATGKDLSIPKAISDRLSDSTVAGGRKGFTQDLKEEVRVRAQIFALAKKQAELDHIRAGLTPRKARELTTAQFAPARDEAVQALIKRGQVGKGSIADLGKLFDKATSDSLSSLTNSVKGISDYGAQFEAIITRYNKRVPEDAMIAPGQTGTGLQESRRLQRLESQTGFLPSERTVTDADIEKLDRKANPEKFEKKARQDNLRATEGHTKALDDDAAKLRDLAKARKANQAASEKHSAAQSATPPTPPKSTSRANAAAEEANTRALNEDTAATKAKTASKRRAEQTPIEGQLALPPGPPPVVPPLSTPIGSYDEEFRRNSVAQKDAAVATHRLNKLKPKSDADEASLSAADKKILAAAEEEAKMRQAAALVAKERLGKATKALSAMPREAQAAPQRIVTPPPPGNEFAAVLKQRGLLDELRYRQEVATKALAKGIPQSGIPETILFERRKAAGQQQLNRSVQQQIFPAELGTPIEEGARGDQIRVALSQLEAEANRLAAIRMVATKTEDEYLKIKAGLLQQDISALKAAEKESARRVKAQRPMTEAERQRIAQESFRSPERGEEYSEWVRDTVPPDMFNDHLDSDFEIQAGAMDKIYKAINTLAINIEASADGFAQVSAAGRVLKAQLNTMADMLLMASPDAIKDLASAKVMRTDLNATVDKAINDEPDLQAQLADADARIAVARAERKLAMGIALTAKEYEEYVAIVAAGRAQQNLLNAKIAQEVALDPKTAQVAEIDRNIKMGSIQDEIAATEAAMRSQIADLEAGGASERKLIAVRAQYAIKLLKLQQQLDIASGGIGAGFGTEINTTKTQAEIDALGIAMGEEIAAAKAAGKSKTEVAVLENDYKILLAQLNSKLAKQQGLPSAPFDRQVTDLKSKNKELITGMDSEAMALKQQQAIENEISNARKGSANAAKLQLLDADLAVATKQLELARARQAGVANSVMEMELKAAMQLQSAARKSYISQTESGRQAILMNQETNLRNKALTNPQHEGGLLSRMFAMARGGGASGGNGSLASFFGSGAMTSLKYAVPSMVMFGAGRGLLDTIREAEEFQYEMSKIKSQIETVDWSKFGMSGAEAYRQINDEIIQLSTSTGLALDQTAKMYSQLFGAFKDESIGGLTGKDLVDEQAAAATKISLTTGLSIEEITDGLTAASLAFGRSFEDIGNIALSLQDQSGVLATQTISFIGDIAPVAKEAGFSLEEMTAIATVAQQRSGRSGTALAESFGRVIPAITENKDKLLELATASDALRTPEFLTAIQNSDAKGILETLAHQYGNLNKEAQDYVVTLLGGRREAQALIPALANSDILEKYTEAAEDSAGTLDKRYNAVLKNISVQIKQLGKELHKLGKALLDSGLGTVIETSVTGLKLMTQLFGKTLSVVGSISKVMQGWPAIMLTLIVLQRTLNALKESERLSSVSGAIGSFARGGGPKGPGFIAAARNAYRSTLYPPTVVAGSGGFPVTGAIAGTRGAAMGAGAKSLLASIGGGSALAGGTMLGIGALVAAGVFVKGQVDKVNEAVQESMKKQDEITQEKLDDLPDGADTTSVIRKRVEDLKQLSKDIEKRGRSWKESVALAFGAQDEAEAALAKSIELDASLNKEAVDFNKAILDNRNLRQAVDRSVFINPGTSRSPGKENIGNLRSLVTQWSPYSGLIKDINKPKLEGQTSIDIMEAELKKLYSNDEADSILKKMQAGTLSKKERNKVIADIAIDTEKRGNKKEREFFKQFRETLGISIFTLPPEVIRAILDPASDPSQVLDELRSKYKDDPGIQAALKLLDEKKIEAVKRDDPQLYADIMKIVDTTKSKTADSTASVDKLKAAYEAGAVSSQAYLQGMMKELEKRKELMLLGEDAGLSLQELMNSYYSLLREIATGITSPRETSSVEALESTLKNKGGDEAANNNALAERALKAIKSGNLNTKDAASMAQKYIDAKKAAVQAMADQAGSDGEAAAILAKGIPLDMNTRVADMIGKIAAIEPAMELFSATFLKFTGQTINAYLSSALGMIDSGNKTAAQVVAEIDANIAKLEASRGRSSVSSLLSAPTDEALEKVKKRQQAENARIDTMISGLKATRDLFSDGSYLGAEVEMEQKAKDEKDKEKKRIDAAKAAFDARINYLKAVAYGDPRRLAQLDAELANKDMELALAMPQGAPGSIEANEREAAIYKAKTSQVEAMRAFAKGATDDRNALYNLAAQVKELDGDVIGSIEAKIAAAKNTLDNAIGLQEQASAKGALLALQEELRKAKFDQETSQLNLFFATLAGDDPVGKAKVDLYMAQRQQNNARGIQAKAEAAKATLEAQRALDAAMNDARLSVFTLRQAELEAMGDSTGAAQVAAQMARQQLADAIKSKAGTATVNQLRAAVITSDKAAADAVFNEKMDDYKWLLDMGQITKGQYINYLEGLKTTLTPGTKQFKDLELTIKQLRDDIGGDLQANLPTSLALPTLYEVRRLNQSTGVTGATGAANNIGYQDNRNMDVKVYVNNGMGESEVLTVLSDALGIGRNSSYPRRF